MIRVAAVGDIHAGEDCVGCEELTLANERADLLLLAGDLTRVGEPREADVVAEELQNVRVPVVAVLGNHDYHAGCEDGVAASLRSAGATVLEGSSAVLTVDGTRVGIAGCKGFGGGFASGRATDFGEPEMKSFVRLTQRIAADLGRALRGLAADLRIALLHYAPVEQTLLGERREIYPFLGSYLLGEAIDDAGADLVVHGHAHHGTEHGVTPGGIPVRNVARPVLRRPFNVYVLGG